MKVTKQVYDSFVENAVRLSNSLELLQMIATEYIFQELPNSAILQLLKKHPETPVPFFKEEVLENEYVFLQTIKILTLMEASETWKDFKNLNKKRKEHLSKNKDIDPNEQLEGFAKILGALASVPKPSKEDLKKYRENQEEE